jgi:hypothetical protein
VKHNKHTAKLHRADAKTLSGLVAGVSELIPSTLCHPADQPQAETVHGTGLLLGTPLQLIDTRPTLYVAELVPGQDSNVAEPARKTCAHANVRLVTTAVGKPRADNAVRTEVGVLLPAQSGLVIADETALAKLSEKDLVSPSGRTR